MRPVEPVRLRWQRARLRRTERMLAAVPVPASLQPDGSLPATFYRLVVLAGDEGISLADFGDREDRVAAVEVLRASGEVEEQVVLRATRHDDDE